eukprot:3115259-Lingulodinium_polyedra.AAC.1
MFCAAKAYAVDWAASEEVARRLVARISESRPRQAPRLQAIARELLVAKFDAHCAPCVARFSLGGVVVKACPGAVG